MSAAWETVIGIEVHVELLTESKMFCGCRVDFDAPPNTNVCPVCLALPGALPVPNERALEWITAIGLALNCRISPMSVFHRKNYFYADLPKNYQISQFDLPVCHDGRLDVDVDGQATRVGIERAHQEEDTGKSIHVGEGGRIHAATETHVDFNRAGVPLVEIVSRPDVRSGTHARAYAQALRRLILALGVSDAKLEEGSMRFDANISVRRVGDAELGTKVEIKNMNSFRSLERACDFEANRQIATLEAGGTLTQETRHWDEADETTHPMRSKEGSSDYRYFTEPDLVPMVFGPDWVEPIRSALPELPDQQRRRYVELGLDPHSAGVLVGSDTRYGEVFEEAVAAGGSARQAANWLTQDVTTWLRREERSLADTPLEGSHLVELAELVAAGDLSSNGASSVIEGLLSGEGRPRDIAAARDLIQISDADALAGAVDEAVAAHPDEFERFLQGDSRLIGFFVGQVMKLTGGKADPRQVADILRGRLG